MPDISKARTVEGWMSEAELLWLANQARGNAKLILEIGCWMGRSSRAIADNAPQGSRVTCLDHWLGSKTERDTYHKGAAEQDRVYMSFLGSMWDHVDSGLVLPIRADFENAHRRLVTAGAKFDFIFLDGGHSYEEVLADIPRCLDLLEVGGVISDHDYSPAWPGVARAVGELLPNHAVAPGTSIWHCSPDQ